MSSTTKILLNSLVGLAGVATAAFLWVSFNRFGFPFEIEWMEGGMLSHAARLIGGDGIYAPPSVEFVPFFYTPGYPWFLAQLHDLGLGLSFGVARAVSLVATILTMATLFAVVKKESSWRFATLGVGLYAGLFRTNGAFYDLARPDALFLLLVLWGVCVAFYWRNWRGVALSVCLFVIAFFTKQTASVFVPAVCLYLCFRNWRHGLVFGVLCFGLASVGIYVSNQASEGWLWTYIFEGHQGHLFYWKNILMEYWRDVLCLAPLLLLLPLLWFSYWKHFGVVCVFLCAHWIYAVGFRAMTLDYVPHMYYRELLYEDPRWLVVMPPILMGVALLAFRAVNRREAKVEPHGYWLLMFVAGVGASGLNHSTQWAYANCFMPMSVFASVLVPLVLKRLLEGSARLAWVLPGTILVQFMCWAYVPQDQIPPAGAEEAVEALRAELKTFDGPIFVPAHPHESWLHDGTVHVHQMGLKDVAFLGGVDGLKGRLAKKQWAAVVVDSRNHVPGLAKHYRRIKRFPKKTLELLEARTGFIVGPSEIWVPRP